jgi:hypothetical protein|nr:MAG TPA: hypothetical protein [Caudoviricetes sp.]
MNKENKDLRCKLALMINTRSFLYENKMITESENERICKRINKFSEKHNIKLSIGQMHGVSFVYDDNTKLEDVLTKHFGHG